MAKELIPSARRLVSSLRDLGYDFESAVADLVDNSIEADANNIHVNIEFLGQDSYLILTDDGRGMSSSELNEAMRFGSEAEYNDDSLGKFGLGMKTASLSQCRKISVFTRNRSNRHFLSSSWNLDELIATNRWIPSSPELAKLGEKARKFLPRDSGTLVLWESLDRLLKYEDPESDYAKRRVAAMCASLDQHLSMVFHRFLEKRKVSLFINGRKLKPWNPFFPNEPKTMELEKLHLEVTHGNVCGEVSFSPFILPHQSQFTSSNAFRNAAGAEGWNQQQGFYIYRADRLIQAGGWSRIRRIDEHLKLARVAIDYDPKLDDAFKINVAKMSVFLPPAIKSEIKDTLQKVWSEANRRYRSSEESPRKSKRRAGSESNHDFSDVFSSKVKVSELVEKAPIFGNKSDLRVYYRILRNVLDSVKGAK